MDDLKMALVITALAGVLLGPAAVTAQTAQDSLATPVAPDSVAVPVAPAAPDTFTIQSVPSAPGAAVAPMASAKKPAKSSDRSDNVPHRYPMVAMALSGVFPGGGQLYTQKYYRAVIFAGAIGYCGYGYYREDKALRRELGLAKTATNDVDFLTHHGNYVAHYDTRRSFQWWGIGVLMVSMIDAYIDAHMFKFDERAEPAIMLRATPASLALSAKF